MRVARGEGRIFRATRSSNAKDGLRTHLTRLEELLVARLEHGCDVELNERFAAQVGSVHHVARRAIVFVGKHRGPLFIDDVAVLDVFQVDDNFGNAVGGAAGGFDDVCFFGSSDTPGSLGSRPLMTEGKI